jgi:hypothetical protein
LTREEMERTRKNTDNDKNEGDEDSLKKREKKT